MKKFILTFLICFISIFSYSQVTASKIIYSNALTHCYVTAIAINDSTIMYQISEKSDRKIWRLTDREEAQSLGLFDKETVINIFKQAINLYEINQLNTEVNINTNISIKFIKIYGIKCVQLTNNLVNSQFNINKKTAIKALEAINNDK